MHRSTESAPAFQFYVTEWRGSRAVQLMTFAVRGMYFEMLLEQWEKFTLPDSPAACAHLLGGTLEEWELAWGQLRQNFVKRGRGGIFNVRLERARRERRAFTEQFAATRKQGGINRAKSAKRGKQGTYLPAGIQLDSSSPPADIQLGPGSSSSSSSSSSSAKERDRAREPAEADQLIDAFRAQWKATYGFECSLILKPLEFMHLEQQIARQTLPRLLAAVPAYFATTETYVRNARHPLPLFLRDPLKYLAKDAPPAKVIGCRHTPPCADEATHTARFQNEQRAS